VSREAGATRACSPVKGKACRRIKGKSVRIIQKRQHIGRVKKMSTVIMNDARPSYTEASCQFTRLLRGEKKDNKTQAEPLSRVPPLEGSRIERTHLQPSATQQSGRPSLEETVFSHR